MATSQIVVGDGRAEWRGRIGNNRHARNLAKATALRLRTPRAVGDIALSQVNKVLCEKRHIDAQGLCSDRVARMASEECSSLSSVIKEGAP